MAAPKNPKGAKSDKEWRDEIRLAVHELREDPEDGKKRKALRMLARRLVSAGLEGEVTALKEIGDRLDGKPTQATTLSAPDGGPVRIIDERTLDNLTDDEFAALKRAAELLAELGADTGGGGEAESPTRH